MAVKQTKQAKEDTYDLKILRGTVVNRQKVSPGDVIKDVDYAQTMILIGQPNPKACMVDSVDDKKAKEKAATKKPSTSKAG